MNQVVKFGGLNCQACQKVIQKRLLKISGVESVDVNETGVAQIETEKLLTKAEIEKAIEQTPYTILEI